MQKFEPSKILLAGGSTPMDFYANYLSKFDAKFLVLDERITEDTARHNQANILKCFDSFEALDFPIHTKTIFEMSKKISSIYNDFFPADVCILGMGEDGHYASIFPESETIFKCPLNHYFFCRINKSEEIRFSLTEKYISHSKHIFLLLDSKNKRKLEIVDAIRNNNELQLPISQLFKKCSKKMSIMVF